MKSRTLNGVALEESDLEQHEIRAGAEMWRVLYYDDEPGDGQRALPVYEVYKATWEWRSHECGDPTCEAMEAGGYLDLTPWEWVYSGGGGRTTLEEAVAEYKRALAQGQQEAILATGTVDLGKEAAPPDLTADGEDPEEAFVAPNHPSPAAYPRTPPFAATSDFGLTNDEVISNGPVS